MANLHLFALLTLVLTLGQPADAASTVKGVRAELISEVSTITPNQTFTVALYLHHFDGFHTYWSNPGKVGVPTSIKWKLPDGFVAGEIHWQVPQRSKMLSYNCHAYRTHTYLLVDITSPATLPKEPFTITAETGWMSCSEKTCCFLAFETYPTTLTPGTAVIWNEKHKKTIQTARDRLPKPDPHWIATATQNHDDLMLHISRKDQKKIDASDDLYFFPHENVSDTEIPQVTTSTDTAYDLKVRRAEYADPVIKRLSGLIYRKAGWSNTHSQHLLIDVPVTQKKPPHN